MAESDPTFGILPILVGRYVDAEVDGVKTKVLQKFKCPSLDSFPDVPHKSAQSTGKTIRQTMTALFKLQGIRADPEDLKGTGWWRRGRRETERHIIIGQ